MLHSEFTQRVQFEVSNEEFEAINVVYMASDLDKDEFCKMWRKMNAKRIKAYKAEKKAEQERFDRISRIHAIKQLLWGTDMYAKIDDVLNKKDIDFLLKNDFDVLAWNYLSHQNEYKFASEMVYDINRWLDKEIKTA